MSTMKLITVPYRVDMGMYIQHSRHGVLEYFAREYLEEVMIDRLNALPYPESANIYPDNPHVRDVEFKFLPDELVYWAELRGFTPDQIFALDKSLPLVLTLSYERKEWFDATIHTYHQARASNGAVQPPTDS